MTTTTQSARDEAGATSPRPAGRRRYRRVIVVVFVLALVVWAIAAVLLLASAAGDLLDARDRTQQARTELADTDAAAASASFGLAREAFADAEANLSHPIVAPARYLPVLGRNLRTVTGLAGAGGLVAEAGADLTGTVSDAGGIGAFAPHDGAVPLEPLEQLAEPAARADDLLAQADARVDAVPDEGLMGPVADARNEFVAEVGDARATVGTAAAVLDGLPAFLGADGPRRYLFGAQNPAELRGTGGLVGAVAILEVDDGRLDFGDFTPVQDLPYLSPDEIEAPNPDYAARYNQFGGAGHWQNLNMTPDFPAAATAMTRLYEAGTGDAVDGVILADPMALAALLEVAGPAEVPGIGTIDAGNVVDFVANQAYAEITSQSARKRLLGDVAAGALVGFLHSPDAEPEAAVAALSDAVAGGHLLAFSHDAEVQEALVAGGVAGRLLDPEGDFLAVVANNSGNHKVDFYTDREVRYDVWLRPDGTAAGRATVRLTNHAPTEGVPSYVIGPNADGLEPGDNRTILSVFCARDCDMGAVRRDGEGSAFFEEELGHPVVSVQTILPSGGSETFQYEWGLPGAWTSDDDGNGVYRLTIQEQPTIRDTALEVVVRLPDGSVVRDATPEAEVGDGQVGWSGTAQRRNEFEVAFGAPAGPPPTAWERVREFLGRPVVRFGGEDGGE